MRLILIFFLFISVSGFGQWKSFIISPRGDTLNRVDKSGKKQGPWAIHVDELRGERGYEEEGYYDNDQKTGTWKKYSLEGVKIAEENYSWGKLNGRQQYFTYNGGLLREEGWRAMDPKRSFDTVAIYDMKDPGKVIDWIVVKNEGVSLKHGRWNYYDPREGRIEATEYYVMNKLRTDEDELVSDEDIKPIDIKNARAKTDTTAKKPVSKPQAILDYEKKNSGKKKIKARDGATGYKPEP
jgi:hypothetical protein